MKHLWITSALNFRHNDSAELLIDQLRSMGVNANSCDDDGFFEIKDKGHCITATGYFDAEYAKVISGFTHGSFTVKHIRADDTSVLGWVRVYADNGVDYQEIQLNNLLCAVQEKDIQNVIVCIDANHPIFEEIDDLFDLRYDWQAKLDSGEWKLKDLKASLANEENSEYAVQTLAQHVADVNHTDDFHYYIRLTTTEEV